MDSGWSEPYKLYPVRRSIPPGAPDTDAKGQRLLAFCFRGIGINQMSLASLAPFSSSVKDSSFILSCRNSLHRFLRLETSGQTGLVLLTA